MLWLCTDIALLLLDLPLLNVYMRGRFSSTTQRSQLMSFNQTHLKRHLKIVSGAATSPSSRRKLPHLISHPHKAVLLEHRMVKSFCKQFRFDKIPLLSNVLKHVSLEMFASIQPKLWRYCIPLSRREAEQWFNKSVHRLIPVDLQTSSSTLRLRKKKKKKNLH